MFLGALKVLRAERKSPQSPLLRNAMTERAVLHTRNLCAALLKEDARSADDVGLVNLFPDYPDNPRYRDLKLAVRSLREACGEGPGSPVYKLGKHFASVRGAYGAYEEAITKLEPEILKILNEILGDPNWINRRRERPSTFSRRASLPNLAGKRGIDGRKGRRPAKAADLLGRSVADAHLLWTVRSDAPVQHADPLSGFGRSQP